MLNYQRFLQNLTIGAWWLVFLSQDISLSLCVCVLYCVCGIGKLGSSVCTLSDCDIITPFHSNDDGGPSTSFFYDTVTVALIGCCCFLLIDWLIS